MLKIMSKIRHENIVKEMKDKHKQELDRKDYEYKNNDKRLRNINTHLKQMLDSSESVIQEKDEQIETLVSIVKRLKGHIEKSHDKEINRFETIARRTKKARIKKKCESKILDYKEKKLKVEKDE